jgi:hypothetical protein
VISIDWKEKQTCKIYGEMADFLETKIRAHREKKQQEWQKKQDSLDAELKAEEEELKKTQVDPQAQPAPPTDATDTSDAKKPDADPEPISKLSQKPAEPTQAPLPPIPEPEKKVVPTPPANKPAPPPPPPKTAQPQVIIFFSNCKKIFSHRSNKQVA